MPDFGKLTFVLISGSDSLFGLRPHHGLQLSTNAYRAAVVGQKQRASCQAALDDLSHTKEFSK